MENYAPGDFEQCLRDLARNYVKCEKIMQSKLKKELTTTVLDDPVCDEDSPDFAIIECTLRIGECLANCIGSLFECLENLGPN